MRKKCKVAWFSYTTGRRVKASTVRKAIGAGWFEAKRAYVCRHPHEILTFSGGAARRFAATVDASPRLARIIVPGR